MFSFIAQFSLTWLLVLILATVANAGIYVVRPSAGSTCRGGQDCQLQWLDDGTSPLLSAIGSCTVGLYFGSQQLVQPLGTVDVSGRRSFTFQVNPQAGPNSDKYYIALVSESLKVNGTSATAWSPFFSLTDMQGSFEAPLPSSAFSLTTPAIPGSSTAASTLSTSIAESSATPISSASPSVQSSSSVTPSASISSISSTIAIPSSSVTSPVSIPPSQSPSTSTTLVSSVTSPEPTTMSIPPTFTSVNLVPESSRFVTSTVSSTAADQTGSPESSNTSNGGYSVGPRESSSLIGLATLALLVNNIEAATVEAGTPREHIDKLTPPPGTSFWRHQRFTLFEDELIGTVWRTAIFTWRIDAYIYVVDAIPNPSFASNGGSIYVVMVNSGSARTGTKNENIAVGPHAPMQYRFGVHVAGSDGAALLQLPPSNSGTKDRDTWKYTAAFSKDLQMFQNNGAQAVTFTAKYSDDISFYKGEQTGDVDGHNSVRWSSILTDYYYDDLSKSIPFPFSSMNCFQFNSLGKHDLVCTINANVNESGQDDPQLVRTATITLDCEFTAPDDS
ncbi:hypothetical protein ONZ45_g9221 [Pleurotus djamor]|nr:hypothetical protein ONZ45_g9221 [Pleurotus djamor]